MDTDSSVTGTEKKLTRPAIGVGSLLIFFTRPGLMELNNLREETQEEKIDTLSITKLQQVKQRE